ncbi:nucleoside triphosphate pyrophosphatase [uncultured Kiloniella sp.]|uniref:Maf family protein n=1 Tax=uncultured Kiloniella sp. TaxID=1133091 RepID=UPI00262BDB76|nr:Maf family protein [uncultured Kiloniella sp.]
MKLFSRQSSATFVLASGSPRRRDLLEQLGVKPDVIDPADIDETPKNRELPLDYAKRISLEKAMLISGRHDGAFVLAADTVVSVGRRILPKAEDEHDARDCLSLLSGRRHRVLTGHVLVLPNGDVIKKVVTTAVKFKRLHQNEIDAYIDSQDWQGKAGGYAIQGGAAVFIPWIGGSYTNVVGLSLPEVANMLVGNGF